MLKNSAPIFSKKALLSEKERILQEIKYYEKRLQEFNNTNSSVYYNENSSSDSEDYFPMTLDAGLSFLHLKHQDSMLSLCRLATQELTGVTVLQSEVNVMVEDPIFSGEKAVSEPGSWREVTAECRIDLVPFSITFFTHQPNRKFAQASHRALRVLPAKRAHEVELSKSVLSGLRRPSDAIEVLRSYSNAHRARRTTLARLADEYANSLFMEPLREGGYILKCANLLEMSWRLENKTSPLAPFHHKMKFDLEYMDESYLKTIKQAHRQLSDPSLQTDERTLLLAKIITTCLEAQGTTQDESMESDSESIRKLEKTILTDDESPATRDGNDDEPDPKKRRDDEVMAPPKSIPKKAKPKGKENLDDNRKSVKRTGSQVVSISGKKPRTDVADETARNSYKDTESARNNVTDGVRRSVKEAKNGVGDKNKVETAAKQKNSEKHVEKEQNEKSGPVKTENQNKNKRKVTDKPKSNEIIEKKSSKVTEKVLNDDKKAGSSKNIVKTTKEGNGNNNKDVPTTKLTKNDKTGQAKLAEVDGNTAPVNDDNDKLEKSSKSAHPKEVNKVNETEKNNIHNHKNAKLINDEAANKNKNKNVIENAVKNIEKTIATMDVANAKNYDKKTAGSKGNPKTTEHDKPEKTEKGNIVNPKNAKNVNTKTNDDKKSKAVEPKTSANQETKKDAIAKKNVKSDSANAKKSVNNPKDKIEKSSKASNVATANKDLTELNDINVVLNPRNDTGVNSATSLTEGLDTNPKKSLSKKPASTKNTASDAKNLASTKNTASDAKNLASTKNTAKDAKNLASTKNTASDAKNLASTKNTASDAKNLASTKNTASDAKNLASTKNTVSDAKNLTTTKNTASDAKNLASTKNTASDAKNLASTKNTASDAKSLVSTKNTDNNAKKTFTKNQDIAKNKEKSKMVIKNHRNSLNKRKKSVTAMTLKPNISKESGKSSKIPQKKLSPAYAEVLKLNPVRISPRMVSKLKASSDSNIQSKLFKAVTNIPRLLKKPAPKSK